MPSSQDGILFRRAYVDLLDGDVLAALMLSQMAYWFAPSKSGKSKLKVKKHDQYWLAKSATHWHSELGYTEKQVYRCINVLKSKGLIITRVMKYDGSPTTHIRLTPSGRVALICPSGDPVSSSSETKFSPQGKSITETTAETTAEIKPSVAVAPQKNIPEDTQEKTAKPIVQVYGVTKAKQSIEVQSLLSVWQNLVHGKAGKSVPKLTLKELSQLKNLSKALAAAGEDPKTALSYLTQNYAKYGQAVKDKKDLKSYPTTPVIGHVLMHYDVLVQLIAKDRAHSLAVLAAGNPAAKPVITVSQGVKTLKFGPQLHVNSSDQILHQQAPNKHSATMAKTLSKEAQDDLDHFSAIAKTAWK